MNRLGRIALPAVVLAALAVVGTFRIPAWRNDRQMTAFAAQLQAVTLPPGTMILSFESGVGILEGDGNHCDFKASVAIQVGEDDADAVEAVAARYEAASFEPAWPGTHQVYTEVVRSPAAVHVTIHDDGYPPGYDMRCH
jgi:hypothetical protein